MLSRPEFLRHLRNDLNHLYDPDHLRCSPLAGILGVADRFDTPSALQRILIEAIEALEPESSEPPHSPASQVYEPLFYRFVEQMDAQQVADQMAIGARHLRRKQQAALQVLADALWRQFRLTEAAGGGGSDGPRHGPGTVSPAIVGEELAWLRRALPDRSTDLNQALPALLDLVSRNAARHEVELETALADSFPELAVHPVALRQIVLSLANVAIPRASGGRVRISARTVRWEVEIRVQCPRYPSGPKPALNEETSALDMAQQLADMAGCRLTLAADARAFDAVLLTPALEQLPVLVVDDNVDTLQLLKRYASGTRYRLITAEDPEHALRLAERFSPTIIVLDVMMPQVDGWELLERLRHHPHTAHVPIIVCTILGQKDFALFLGASGFIPKPVTREAFLDALNQQAGLMERGPH